MLTPKKKTKDKKTKEPLEDKGNDSAKNAERHFKADSPQGVREGEDEVKVSSEDEANDVETDNNSEVAEEEEYENDKESEDDEVLVSGDASSDEEEESSSDDE